MLPCLTHTAEILQIVYISILQNVSIFLKKIQKNAPRRQQRDSRL